MGLYIRKEGRGEFRRMGIFTGIMGRDFIINHFLFYKSILKKGSQMKKILFFLLSISFITTTLSGCAAVVAGTAIGAAGGYAASKDTIQGDTDKPYDSLWNTSQDVARSRGTIKEDNYTKGTIKLVASDSSLVWIKLIRMTRATTRLRVSSRRFHLPKLELAQELYTKIMDEVR